MTIHQALAAYGAVILVLLIGLGIYLARNRTRWAMPALPRMAELPSLPRWHWMSHLKAHAFASSDFWIKVLLATFIALSTGVSLVMLLFPLGVQWTILACFTALLLLAALLHYLEI